MSNFKGNSNVVSYEDHMIVPHEDGKGWDILIRMELLTPMVNYQLKTPMTEEVVKYSFRQDTDMKQAPMTVS